MKPTKSKAEIREEIASQIDSYLTSGGEVKGIPKGVSGNPNNTNLFKTSPINEPKKDRTLLNDVVKDLEERKKNSQQSSGGSSSKKLKRPRKKLITDDFGEPLRWVWVDE